MVARVTHYRIRPGKLEEFTATARSLTATIDKLKGFRVLLVLRADESSSDEAMAISIWDSPGGHEGQRQRFPLLPRGFQTNWLLREFLAHA